MNLFVRTICAFCLLSAVLPAAPLNAQTPQEFQGVRQELNDLRGRVEMLQKDVDTIRNLLQMAMAGKGLDGAVAPASTAGGTPSIRVAGRPTKGSPSARLLIVEFADYECEYCAQFAAETWPQIERDYIATSKVRYIFKHFPVVQAHPNAFKAAVAASCAGEQSRFWPMHARLFAHQDQLAPAQLAGHAAAVGLDVPRFTACLDGTAYNATIQEDINEALKGGVRGTPVFVLAYAGADADTVVPVRVLVGAQPYAVFKEAMDALLAQRQEN